MKSNPSISIITVCFNCEAHIAETLRSVDMQTMDDREHIVIDGASTDRTLEILESRQKPWRRVLSAPDKGIYDAMNKGLRLASGDFVGFLNADDSYASESVLADIAQAASSPTRPDAIYGDLQYVQSQAPYRVVRHWHSGAYSHSRLIHGWMPPHPTFYIRRSRLETVGEFDLRFRIAADYDFMLRCMTQPDFRLWYVSKVLVRMRLGGASNRSPVALWHKSSEDLAVLRKNKVGGVTTLLWKNLRKVPQFLRDR